MRLNRSNGWRSICYICRDAAWKKSARSLAGARRSLKCEHFEPGKKRNNSSRKFRKKKSDEKRTHRSVAAICGAGGRRGSGGDAVWIRYSRGRALARWCTKGERRDPAASTRGGGVDSHNRNINNRCHS